jgi:hypothetical protein
MALAIGNAHPSGAVRANCPPAPHPWIQLNPAAVLGSAGLDRRDAVVFIHPAEARRTLRRSPVGQLEQCRLQLNGVEVVEPA